MAIVNRFFSPAGAGAADGTSPANGAPLLNAGAWSTIITGFNFSGSDVLECRIGPGTYTPTVQFLGTLFANPPTTFKQLTMHGCDAGGNKLVPPNLGWKSCDPPWDASALPEITTTTNVQTTGAIEALFRMLKFTSNARLGVMLVGVQSVYDWCVAVNSASNTTSVAAAGGGANRFANCVLSVTGATNAGAIQNSSTGQCIWDNCRCTSSGSAGNRRGFLGTGGLSQIFQGCTFVNCPGGGMMFAVSATQLVRIERCLIANCGGSGITRVADTQLIEWLVSNCMITGCTGWGIESAVDAIDARGNRLRDNSSGNISGLTNWPVDMDNDVTDIYANQAAADAAEFVDYAGGNYRIRAGSPLHGKGYGVADEILVSSSLLIPSRRNSHLVRR